MTATTISPRYGQACEELEQKRRTADLGRQRHQVHELGRDQYPGPDPEPHPFSHRVEHGALRGRGHPAAHLRVDDDPDHADDDHPEELVAERRACLDVEDEVADIDEPADRGQDPERDLEELAHLASRSARLASRSRSAETDAPRRRRSRSRATAEATPDARSSRWPARACASLFASCFR